VEVGSVYSNYVCLLRLSFSFVCYLLFFIIVFILLIPLYFIFHFIFLFESIWLLYLLFVSSFFCFYFAALIIYLSLILLGLDLQQAEFWAHWRTITLITTRFSFLACLLACVESRIVYFDWNPNTSIFIATSPTAKWKRLRNCNHWLLLRLLIELSKLNY
jgi:hypothetical protein